MEEWLIRRFFLRLIVLMISMSFICDMASFAAEDEMASEITKVNVPAHKKSVKKSKKSNQPQATASAMLKGQKTDEDYVLTEGDKVRITIYPEDEYIKGGEVELSSDGNITLPIVGKIPIANKTVLRAEKVIAKVLKDGYFKQPEVIIEVLKFKDLQVVILGQVKRPGPCSFPPGTNRFTLLQAIALAGGFSDIANIKKIRIIRKLPDGRTEKIHANADKIISGKEEDVELQPGDVIHVPESFF